MGRNCNHLQRQKFGNRMKKRNEICTSSVKNAETDLLLPFALTKKKKMCYTCYNLVLKILRERKSDKNGNERVSTNCASAQRGNGWWKFSRTQEGKSPWSSLAEPAQRDAGVGWAGSSPLSDARARADRCFCTKLGGTTEKSFVL